MRCFVAIEIDQQCRLFLKRATEQLEKIAGNQKWVKPENMHMTLKFIGNDIDEEQLPEIIKSLQMSCQGIPPFNVRVEGLGGFPPQGRPKVIFAEVKEDSGYLKRLAENIDNNLAMRAGIKRDNRRFIPHITLGRCRKGHKASKIECLTQELDNLRFGAFEITEVVLKKSDLKPSGPEYTILERFKLD